ncbi:QRFP-like peptide receptor [Brevipalpus obovatus]|uniref:QRFP-like peptide receptor n=1 Tax=Brevipalpus obovatus TaxID=246614 RepID=UPI003D9E1F91
MDVISSTEGDLFYAPSVTETSCNYWNNLTKKQIRWVIQTENYSGLYYQLDRDVWVHKPIWEMCLKSFLFFVITVVSLIGNFLIVRVIVRFKNSRNCTNLFICNMAIADLGTTITCAWAACVNNLFQNYVLGSFFCEIETSGKVLFLIASVFTLTWISCDRLVGIIRPFRNPMSKRNSFIIMTLIWMISFLIALPVYFWREYRTRQWCDYYETWCKEDTRKIEVYWFLILAFLVYIPLFIMTIAYCSVICKMKKFEQKISTEENSVKIRHRRKVIMMLFIYLITSAICWTPLQVIVFNRFFALKSADSVKPWNGEVKFWAHVFASLNSAVNPIIYGIINESFRKAICLLYPKLSWFLRLDRYNPRKSRHETRPMDREHPRSIFTIGKPKNRPQDDRSRKINEIPMVRLK